MRCSCRRLVDDALFRKPAGRERLGHVTRRLSADGVLVAKRHTAEGAPTVRIGVGLEAAAVGPGVTEPQHQGNTRPGNGLAIGIHHRNLVDHGRLQADLDGFVGRWHFDGGRQVGRCLSRDQGDLRRPVGLEEGRVEFEGALCIGHRVRHLGEGGDRHAGQGLSLRIDDRAAVTWGRFQGNIEAQRLAGLDLDGLLRLILAVPRGKDPHVRELARNHAQPGDAIAVSHTDRAAFRFGAG